MRERALTHTHLREFKDPFDIFKYKFRISKTYKFRIHIGVRVHETFVVTVVRILESLPVVYRRGCRE